MSEPIERPDIWTCPECRKPLDAEECEDIAKRLLAGSDQIEFRCDDCGESLTADTTDCPDMEVSINPEWVYG